MGDATKGIKNMAVFAVVAVALAITVVLGIVLLENFKATSGVTTTGNASIDDFISGLTVFGSFMGIISLALVGKIIMSLFSTSSK